MTFLENPKKLALSGGLCCIKLILLKTLLTKFVPFNEINMSLYLYKQQVLTQL
jgi:hypothetical protein